MFRWAREEAMLQVLANAKGKSAQPTTQELIEAAEKAEKRKIEMVGNRSENKFVEFASKSRIVKCVVNANPLYDAYDAIDKWVVLIDGFNLPPLPVQIKSSRSDVEVFKRGDTKKNKKPNLSFRKLHGLMLVLNCGPSSNPKIFDKQLRKEVGRIVNIISTDPKSTKHLSDITPNRFKDSNSFKIRG
jgi:hypothetical protein